jgi:hypothetical protein
MKPLCFLDVDGVLNVFRATGLSQDLHNEDLIYKNPAGGRWTKKPVILDRRHPQLLAMLAADFELVWGTAWEDAANQLLSELLGLEQLPVVHFYGPRYTDSPLHWKTERLAEYADGRPFCWIDDEADRHDAAWLRATNPATLVLVCDPAEGLGEKQVLAALDFAAALAVSPR